MISQDLPLGFSELLTPFIISALLAFLVYSCIVIKKSFSPGDVDSNGIQKDVGTRDDLEGQSNHRIQKSLFCSVLWCFKEKNYCKHSDPGITSFGSKSSVASVNQDLLPGATQKENTVTSASANESVTWSDLLIRCFKRKDSANIVHDIVPPHAKNEGCDRSDNQANIPVKQSNIFTRCFKRKGSSKIVHINVPPVATQNHEESKRSDDPVLITVDETAQAIDNNYLKSLCDNREEHLEMAREQKRKLYIIKTKPVTKEEIPTWDIDPNNASKTPVMQPNIFVRCFKRKCSSKIVHINVPPDTTQKDKGSKRRDDPDPAENTTYTVDEEINKKISVWKGDITRLEIDAIVNAANTDLRGGGGVDGAIHRAAGPDLLEENRVLLKSCPTGEARVAAGYRLPAYYVIHTNGPRDRSSDMLEKCYNNCLSEVLNNDKIRTVAFPAISTGVYGFPMKRATHVAAKTVRKWLEKNKESVDRIIFCAYNKKAAKAAYKIFPKYFPKKVSSENNF